MKILRKLLTTLSVTAIGLGIIMMGVSMVTGGGLGSVMSHQVAGQYIELQLGHIMDLLYQGAAWAEIIFIG